MKRLFIVIAGLTALCVFADLRKTITLGWDYPADELTNILTFKLYSSTDPGVPLTNWTVLTNISGTLTNITLPIQPGRRFFTMTASNWWGESDFSNIADTPHAPGTNLNLKIK